MEFFLAVVRSALIDIDSLVSNVGETTRVGHARVARLPVDFARAENRIVRAGQLDLGMFSIPLYRAAARLISLINPRRARRSEFQI